MKADVPQKKMPARFYSWFNKRTGIRNIMRASLDEPVHGGARWAYIFGSGLLFIFISQVITGLCLALYYVPSAESAHTSVAYITKEVAAGNFLRSLHYYGSSAMIVVLLLHFLQTFLYGSFKGRRELLWISGAFLSFLVLGMGFTGYLLPWDQSSYFATAVGTNIVGEVPFIGQWLTDMLRGGDTLGTLTLSRFYFAHVFLIPAMIFLFIGLHIALFRKAGAAGPIDEDPIHPQLPPESFYPRQVIMDMAFALLLMVGLGFLAYFHPVQLGPIANPANTQFIPRPEWYYLPMFEWLKFWPGRFEAFAVIAVPGTIALLFFLVPFLDRKLERRPWRRPIPLLAVTIVLVGTIFLGIRSHLDDLRDPTVASQLAFQAKQAEEYTKAPFHPVMQSANGKPLSSGPVNPLIAKGKGIFDSKGCSGCHGSDATGTAAAPSLVGITAKYPLPQLTGLLHHPNPAMLAGHMPSFDLSAPDMTALFSYLGSLGKSGGSAPAATPSVTPPTPAASPAPAASPGTTAPAAAPGASSAAAQAGEKVFQSQGCVGCHGPAGAGTAQVPPLKGLVAGLSDQQLSTLLHHHNAKMRAGGMPPFTGTPAEEKSVIAYIHSLAPAKQAAATQKPATPAAPAKKNVAASSAAAPAAPAAAAPAAAPGASSAAAQAGEKVFQSQGCIGCHGPAGAGTAQVPPLKGLVAGLSDQQLSTLLHHHNAKMRAGGMPPFTGTPAEEKSVIAYIHSLAPAKQAAATQKPAATAAPAPSAKAPAQPAAAKSTPAAKASPITEGHAIFVSNGCSSCHGQQGTGTHFAPSLVGITHKFPGEKLPYLIHHPTKKMRDGGMPTINVQGEDMQHLVAYLGSLGAAPAAGGAPAAKAGPGNTPVQPAQAGSSPNRNASVGAQAASAPPPPTPLQLRGQQIFQHNRCETCHGIGGLTGTVAAPPLAGTASLLPAAVLENLLRHHTIRMQQGGMPLTNMNPPDMKALVAFIRSLPATANAK
ncbi:MAG: c-type cytochrome [Acidobacteriaceae bacterium]